jgi:hypothetical protein
MSGEARKQWKERIGSIEEMNKRLKTIPGCKGRLERKRKSGAYELVWEGELANALAPVSVLVSDSGKYVVTFDDWHAVGRGRNVVVIYGPKGKLVRKLALEDFLSPRQIGRLPISVSSTWWGSGCLDDKQEHVVLHIAADAQEKPAGKTARPLELRVRLATGAVVKDGK